MRTAFGIILALGTLAPRSSAQLVGILPDSAVRAFYRDHKAEYDVEARAILATKGTVSRAGGRLTLRPERGAPLVLVDTIAEGDQHHRYLYRQWFRLLGIHDVESWLYEGGAHIVLHAATGQTRIVPGPVLESPDHSRFASASDDLEAHYDPNHFDVFRVSATGLQLEYALDGGEAWGPEDVKWLSPSVLQFQRVSLAPAGDRRSATRWLMLVQGKWQVRSRAP